MNKINITIKKNDYFWNTISTILYSATSIFLNFFVINIMGGEAGGLFSFGYSTLSHIVYIISYFGVRSFQSIDVKNKYSFSDYLFFRYITCFFATLFGLSYIFFLYSKNIYSMSKAFFLIVIIFTGIVEGFFDVYDGEFQRNNKLYIAGQALFLRTVVFIVIFIFMIIITKNLIIASFVAILSKCLASILFEIFRFRFTNKYKFDINKIRIMFTELVPFFLITILDGYIHSMSKFFIDIYLNDVSSGVYNLLFIPSNIIYMFCMFIVRPMITPISEVYNEDIQKYINISKKIFKISIILSIIVMCISFIFGSLYLNILDIFTKHIYNMSTSKEIFIVFLLVMSAGIFYTINTPIFFMLIIENKKNYLLKIYIFVFIISIIISNFLVKFNGIIGAGISFLITMFLLNFLILKEKIYNYV